MTLLSCCNWTSSSEIMNGTLSSTEQNLSEIQTLSSKTKLFVLVMKYVGAAQFFMCFLPNALTIASVVKFDYLHKKSTNLLILSLSLADGLLGELIFFYFFTLSWRKCLVPRDCQGLGK